VVDVKRSRLFANLRGGILFLLLILLTVSSIIPAYGAEDAWSSAEAPPEESRVGSVYLLNLENQLTLYEKQADEVIYPASAAKIMTGLLACRTLESRAEETVEITAPMLAGSAGRSLGLVPGELLKISDLLMAAVCGSYNDAACVVAFLSAGSVDAFVDMMNQEAKRIGADHTVYRNPTGLHHPEMVTTARDTALIACEAMKNELFMTLISTHAHVIAATNASEARTISNRHALVSDTGGQYYNGWCRGINAGMTDEGGWCVVTLWEKDGAANLSVVMNGTDVAVGETIPAYAYTNRLLSWAGRSYGYRTVLPATEALDTLSVAMTGTSRSQTDLFVPTDLRVYLPTHADLATQVSLDYHLTDGGLTAPLKEGQTVGTVTVTYGGAVIGSSPVVVKEAFERNGFLNAMDRFKGYLCSRAFVITAVVFVILLVIYLKYTTGPGRRYTTRETYHPPKRRNKKFRSLKKSRRP